MKRVLDHTVAFLLAEKLPVWATILGIILGAIGTYYIVPGINQSLEKQKIRSEFVIRNLDDLNARTRSLVSDVSDIQYGVLRTSYVDSAAIQKVLSKIAEMQWKAIELAVIFEGTQGARSVQQYQEALDHVRAALVGLKSKEDLKISQAAIEQFSERTLNVLRELAAVGGIRISAKTPKA
ncbi:hypothetical protein [Bradyrhizobium sp. USDA 10063]